MRDKNTFPTFSDDTPQVNPWSDDKLGFRPFAKRLAGTIINLNAKNGYVFGLHGAWGSGKTTAINFVESILTKYNQELENQKDRIEILRFEPWIVSGHQDLIGAFFKVLIEALHKRPTRKEKFIRNGLSYIRRYNDPLLEAAGKVGRIIDPSGGIAANALIGITKKSLNKWLEEPSLQAAYAELKIQLEKHNTKFLVIIDDIDRLEPQEIATIMQMVKTIGRLPNVIYLLAYDRRSVWSALDKRTFIDPDGPNFAEKIVQQELELPKPSRHALLSIFDREVDYLFTETPNTYRWYDIIRNGIWRWIRHPRDVARYTNAIKFAASALDEELDIQDIFAMEGLRLFDPIAFNWVRWNRDFLFGEGIFRMSSDERKTAAVDALRDSLPRHTQHETLRILSLLFPNRAKFFSNNQSTTFTEAHYEVVRRRGVGCEAGYDAYFNLYPSPNSVPKRVIEFFVSHDAKKQDLENTYRSFLSKRDERGRSLIGELLTELIYQFTGNSTATPTIELLGATFDIADDVLSLDEGDDMLLTAPQISIGLLVQEMLRVWGRSDAMKNLIQSFKSGSSVALCSDIFVEQAIAFNKLPNRGSSSSPIIHENDLEPLGKLLIKAIENQAAHGTLQYAPIYGDIIRAWNFLGGPESPRNWISSGVGQSTSFLVKVLRGLLAYTISTSEREYSVKSQPDTTLYDLHIIGDACKKHLSKESISNDQRKVITAFKDYLDNLPDHKTQASNSEIEG